MRDLGPGGARCWCHRDVQPQNWLVGDGFALVDFEHCRPDHPLEDWVRLEARGWSSDRRAAFVRGYGMEPDEDELRAVLLGYGVATAAWAAEHGDEELLAIGLSVLRSS